MGGDDETQVRAAVDWVFRQEAGKIVATLTGIFGLRNLELVEDALQEALLKALKQWSYGNIPRNPFGWLVQVSRNRVLDVIRRDARLREKEAEIISSLEQPGSPEEELLDEEIKDDQLRMIFACSHPSLPRDSQIALTLKTLCGFGVSEIARGFLTSTETIAKRLTRARQRLQKNDITFVIPSGAELSDRLETVLSVLYLMFNEGYNASRGTEVIRADVCQEAIRLARLLQEQPVTALPQGEALLALMLFQAARFSSRSTTDGEILLLREQDRTRWNSDMIAHGMTHLTRSAAGIDVSVFHLQAAIAGCHCTAPSYETTDWKKILSLYDLLLHKSDSPVIALNRAVALSEVDGPEAGLKAMSELKQVTALRNYYLYYAVLAEFFVRLNKWREAADNYQRAIELTDLIQEKMFLTRRLQGVLDAVE